MTPKIVNEFPVHLLVYPSRLAFDEVASSYILKDEYVFSTYIATLLQGFKFEEAGGDDDLLAKILADAVPGFSFDPADNDVNLDLSKQERLMKFVQQLRHQFNEQVTTTYVKDFLLSTSLYRSIMKGSSNQKKAHNQLCTVVSRMMEVLIKRQKGTSAISLNVEHLMNIIDLSMAETRLLELAYFFSTDVRALIFRDVLFQLGKDSSMFEHCYKVMLGEDEMCPAAEIDDALSDKSKPIQLGIISYDLKSKRMDRLSEFWVYATSNYADTDEAYYTRFVEELKEKKRTFSGAIAKMLPKDEELFRDFLKRTLKVSESAQVAKNIEFIKNRTTGLDPELVKNLDKNIADAEQDIDLSLGMNALIYGSGRLDKIGLVIEQLKTLEIPGLQVRTRDASNSDIPSITYVAQMIVHRKHKGSVLVVNKTEKALSKRNSRPSWYLDMFGDDDSPKKESADLESDEMLLIKNPVPTVWLTSSPSDITAENVGRFLFHTELKGGSRKDRRVEIEKVVEELGFSDEVSQKLSKYLELNVEQIKSAAKMVKMLELTGEEGEASLLHLVENSQKALDRTKQEQLRTSVTTYNLDLLNLAGNIKIEKIIEALKKKPKGGLCLFGPPGTGKTQLVEYMAVQLDMPLIIKPASELLNMYIGETEKNIAKAFQEAKDEGAILLLDEADSFLRDRAMAHRSWEVTQVNELLMRMERFTENGIFFCATNLMTNVDAAALRRFTFKLEFRPLTFEQRFKMLSNECAAVAELSDAKKQDLQIDLQLIKFLTPGDFAVVKRQANLMDENLSIKDWLDRLTIESKAKMVGMDRNVYNGQEGGEVTSRQEG